MDYNAHKSDTISGIKWNILSQLLNQGVTFVVAIILMRLVKPKEFGLLGMVTVFSGFLSVFKDFGLGSSLVHKREIDELDKHTLFWAILLFGSLLTGLFALLGKPLAAFYGEPRLVGITTALSFVFVVESTGSLQLSLLQKGLHFKKIFSASISGVVASGIIATYMAYSGFGVWALVVQQLVNVTVVSVVLWIASDYFPAARFSMERLRGHLDYSLSLVGNNSLNYWARNADNFLIGKFLGAEPLGFYSRAYSIMMIPVGRISGTIGSVMFPSFSIIQNETERIKYIYLKMSRVIAFVTFPLMGTLIVIADPFVRVVLGPKWLPMVPVLRVLAIIGSIQSIGTLVGTIFLSQGATKLAFKLTAFASATYIAAFIIGSRFSIVAVALAYLIAVLVMLYPQFHLAGRLIGCSAKEMLLNVLPEAVATVFLILAGVLVCHTVPENLQGLRLVLGISEFGIGWFLASRLFNQRTMKELLSLIKELRFSL